ncbi:MULTISPECIES: hypothetical protein [Microbacterium]|uniref:Uncharacterized protein n=2 Tax=Microbacterium maritypicum TaxID=33918 RepID=A0ACD4B4H2_MICMQ|nr:MULTISPECIES: hypothetical protein [Microbacterium]QYG12812.1 hypothetical protein KY497_06010 [Microbacterium sp. PAMC22086]UTT52430.1 hypothetical protein NMQ05_15300 [Microbacterium liquefaciens]GEC76627.1 hypothetical protein MLI01_27720 [Microbacterium liquefaciens]GGV63379.1 hypothetical protein GCM10010213_28220 [Microbacterium liquefaciens]
MSHIGVFSAAAPEAAPEAGAVFAFVIILLTVAASFFIVVIHVCVAAVLRPPRPLAETSVLGRHIVGLAKIVLGFLGFFGGLLLTTIIAMGNDHWGSSAGLFDLMDQLWGMFLVLIAFVAYGYWLWIALDLIRLGEARRLSAVEWWYRTWLHRRVGVRWVERAARATAQAVVGGPWWALLLTFYAAPLILIVAVMELVRMLTRTFLP